MTTQNGVMVLSLPESERGRIRCDICLKRMASVEIGLARYCRQCTRKRGYEPPRWRG